MACIQSHKPTSISAVTSSSLGTRRCSHRMLVITSARILLRAGRRATPVEGGGGVLVEAKGLGCRPGAQTALPHAVLDRPFIPERAKQHHPFAIAYTCDFLLTHKGTHMYVSRTRLSFMISS